MGIKERIGRECRKPTGAFGRLVARKMNRSHYPVTMWGLRFLDTGEGSLLLDVGCGGGRNLDNLANMADGALVVGMDHSRDMVSLSRRLNRKKVRQGRIEVIEGSVSTLPFTDGVFDAVTAVETHFFWPDLGRDLREVLRILKPGGMLLIIAEGYRHPAFEERNKEWETLSDFTMDTPQDLKACLKDAGYCDVDSSERVERNWMVVQGRRPL